MAVEYEHTFAYEKSPVRRARDGVVIGVQFDFHDRPVSVGRDADGDLPNTVFLEYDRKVVGEQLEYPVVKVVADDGGGAAQSITRAVAFFPASTSEDHAEWWNRLHFG